MTTGSWDADSWEVAIAPNAEDSLYGAAGTYAASEAYPPSGYQQDTYQPVNDWSGVYAVVPEAAAPTYDYDSYGAQQAYQPAQPTQATQPDQSYYESVYAAYAQPIVPEPVQESSPMWDGPAWQDPYAAPAAPASFYGDPLTDPYPAAQGYEPAGYEHRAYEPQGHDTQAIAAYAPQDDYATPGYAQPQYEAHNFHHPEFDTGEFEAVYAAPDATDAEYDLLPEGEGLYDAYDGAGYEAEYGLAGDTDDAYFAAEYDEDDEGGDDPDNAPLRSRSRSGAGAPAGKPFGTGASSTRLRPPSGRRTLSTLTSAPAAVVGVAAVAVAAVGGLRLPGHTEAAQVDPTTPSSGLEQNLLQMRAASANLADRATRSEQRSELSQQQALERQRLAEMAPRFFLPVQDVILTASFGDAGARWSSLHTGQDFAVPTGTKVVSVTDGVVVEAGWAGAFGYRIVVSHPDGSQTWYCHLSVMKVKSGPVKAGQLIAYSGDTGNSTGPHLHFEYHPPGPADINNGVPGASTAVNPIPFLKAHGLLT